MTNNVVLTVEGMYLYDPHIFDSIKLPLGADVKIVIETILQEYSDLQIQYTNPKYLKWAVGTWAKRRFHSWERFWNIQTIEYNPVHNFDRFEDTLDLSSGKGKSNSKTNTKGSENDSVVPYNADTVNTYTPQSKSENIDEVKGEAASESTGSNEHTGHLYGNIGVTKTQEMARDELEFWEWDFYKAVADEFAKEFCIGIY